MHISCFYHISYVITYDIWKLELWAINKGNPPFTRDMIEEIFLENCSRFLRQACMKNMLIELSGTWMFIFPVEVQFKQVAKENEYLFNIWSTICFRKCQEYLQIQDTCFVMKVSDWCWLKWEDFWKYILTVSYDNSICSKYLFLHINYLFISSW